MTKENIRIICEIISAFSTSLGVGAAIAYYLKVILNISIALLVIAVTIYFLVIIFLIKYFSKKLKEDKNENS